jgi:hypothetical protein
MHPSPLTWDSFESLSPDAERTFVVRFCLFSLATLEVAACSDAGEFALVEREHCDAWRWAVIGPDGFITDSGTEPTRACAKTAVARSLHPDGVFAMTMPHG